MMKRIGTLMKSSGLLLSLCVISSAGATPPTDVNIEVETFLTGDPGPFVASGPAVDIGLMCGEGAVVDDSGKVTGSSRRGFNFHGVKRFSCDDGSGDFFVRIQARIDFTKGTTFNWIVLGGTGDYEDLHGAGSGIGLPGVPCGDPLLCVLDIYIGGLHIK
jgi:hypothetical protein